jgi:hypothetical protein
MARPTSWDAPWALPGAPYLVMWAFSVDSLRPDEKLLVNFSSIYLCSIKSLTQNMKRRFFGLPELNTKFRDFGRKYLINHLNRDE